MSWLSNVFKFAPKNERVGISLGKDAYWYLEFNKKNTDLADFMEALIILFPENTILYLEGTYNPKIKDFLRLNSTDKITKVALGIIWPRPEFFHIPITSNNIAKLTDLAKNCAIPEICIHLQVYKDEYILLEAFDIFSAIYLSQKVEENLIKLFCEKLKWTYRRVTEND